MKNLLRLSFLAILIAVTSCKNDHVEKNIKMYSETWDEIINQGKLDLINETHFTQDITLVSSAENIVGIEEFKAYYSNFVTGFSEPEFTIVDIFGQGDKMVKHWHFKGVHSGDFFGIPATGKTVDIEGTTLVKMKDGKIAQEQDFMDNMVFMQQLGILSNPNNVNVINSIYEDFSKGNIEGVVAKFDSNIIWNEAEGNEYADGNPYVGPDAVVSGVFGRVGSEWNNFRLVDIKLHDMSNNQVLATLRYNGTYKATGKSIDAQVAHLWTLSNEKAIGFQQYVDTKQLAQASKLGLSK